ncbi:MAG: Calx-beta domain-containing protein, partial [Gammaproteobacteria bacterium]
VSGFTVSSISNNTAETGTTASFTVELTSEPTATVTVGVSSSDISEGIVDSSVLTFTPQNWNSAQTVTVTGVDDDVADGNQPFTVQLAPAVSSDGVYDGIDPTDVPVTNNDNDTSGIDVSAISGNTTEAGGSATFTVVLSSAPIADVTIGITSSNTNEGSVAGISSIIFTPDNWNTVQTVTVTGVNDDVDDGDQTYTIVLAEAVSTDSGYSGINPDDVSVTNIDDDIAGFIVGDISGNTTEAGGSATFTVTLTSEPTAAVGVDVSSSDTTEGTVNPNTLSFTSNNWNDPHTVTVTGVDDTILDGDQQYSIVLAQATSIDPNYAGFNPADVVVINIDNDNATPPTVSNGAITLTDVNGTGMSLSWNRASDTYYQQSELQYQVYYATSNVLTSVTNTESNGTLAMDWANDVTSFTTSNLSGLTDYYWNIIVRNPAGLKALYSTATEKTFAAGIPDQSFGSGGRIEFGNEDGMDQYLRKMIKTSDGNFLLVGSTTVTDSDIVLKKVSPSGQLIFDTVHDDGGNESASDVTVDANNNIYVSGAKDQLMTVWRFDSQGNIDTGFGVNGRINHAGGVGQGNDDGSVVMIDSQGNIVVIGSSWNNGDYDFFVWRFTSTGALDTQNFAAPNGYFSIDGPAGGNGWDRALSGIIDNNGRIIVGGFFDSGLLDNQSTDVDGVVLVLDSSGTLDSQFGGGAGYVILNEGVISADRVSDIAIDSSGYILGVGITGPALSTDMIIWSLDPITGALNPNFNQGQGWLSHDGAGGFIGLSDSASGITIDPRSNNIVVVGTSFSYVEVSPYLNQMTLWRLTPDGTLDTSFDNDGFASFFSATHADGDGVGRAVLIGNDESIYSAGYTYGGANTDADFAIWNYR